MIGDGGRRLLRAIAERIAPERVEEVYLFPPMRQGGRETGVAVVAVRRDAVDGEPTRDVERLTVYRASYRLTLKGPERGAWEVGITEDADAPSLSVDAVVRGVHERAGGEDEPERLTGEAFRAALAEEPWTATR